MYSSESPTAAIEKLPSYIKNRNSSYYILEIENETRPFILQAKSHFDLEEWFNAIYAQIESLKTNRAIQSSTKRIREREKEMAVEDQRLVRKTTQFNMIFTPEIQPQLLDFVNDAFIKELLPGITNYVFFAESKEQNYSKHALKKAAEILDQLKTFQAEAKQHLSIKRKQSDASAAYVADGTAQIRKYKKLSLAEKINCLIIDDELTKIEASLREM